jgi:hypothetical protein
VLLLAEMVEDQSRVALNDFAAASAAAQYVLLFFGFRHNGYP